MKKNLLFLFVSLMTVIGVGLVSCSGGDADAKVNAFVEILQSEDFTKQALKNDLFTGVETKVEDNVVELTFKTIPGLSFKKTPKEVLENQKTMLMTKIKQAVVTDKLFREGLEGMKEKNMTFRMTFLDTNGDSASIDIAPSEVLE